MRPLSNLFSFHLSDRYQYERLPDASSFRVLELQPGRDRDPIEIHLRVVNWDSPPDYEAISYTWGNTRHFTACVCDGRKLLITKNLHEALCHFRYPDACRMLWADAICINQGYNDEKNHQVKNMRRIYENSSTTLVWLGPDEKGLASTAFDAVERLGGELLKCSEHTKQRLRDIPALHELMLPYLRKKGSSITCSSDEWKALHALYSLPWFSRLWVIQEFNASQILCSVWGKCIQDSRLIALIATWISHDNAIVERELHSTHVYCCGIMNHRHFKQFRTKYLTERLWLASTYLVTDPRDAIFAMMDTKFTSKYQSLEPDYSRSRADVYKDFTRAHIQETQGLRVLDYVSHPDSELFKPSWVPRWDKKTSGSVIGVDCYFNASKGSESFLQRVDIQKLVSSEELVVSGIIFDEIVTSSDSLINSKLSLDPHKNAARPGPTSCKKEWESLLQPTAHYQTQDVYLDAYAATLTCGYNLDQTRVNEDQRRDEFAHFLDDATQGQLRIPAWNGSDNQDTSAEFDPFKFRRTVNIWTRRRRMFWTAQGYIGMGPSCAKEHDNIAILFGGNVPFIIRQSVRQPDKYQLVGEVYVHGIMDGELVTKLKNGQLPGVKQQDIFLI